MIGFFAMAIVFTSDAAFLLIMVLIYIYLATFRNHIAPIIQKKESKKDQPASKQTVDFSTSQ
jgi:hypothetical protein